MFAKTISEGDVYDRIRFIKPVFIGDTFTVTYTITEIDEAKRRSRSTVEAHNQHRQIAAAAQHLIQGIRKATLA